MALVNIIRSLIIPGVLAIGVFLSSLIYIKVAFPDVTWGGSTFLNRSGLDGDAAYCSTNKALLSRSGYTPSYPQFSKNIEILSDGKQIGRAHV